VDSTDALLAFVSYHQSHSSVKDEYPAIEDPTHRFATKAIIDAFRESHLLTHIPEV